MPFAVPSVARSAFAETNAEAPPTVSAETGSADANAGNSAPAAPGLTPPRLLEHVPAELPPGVTLQAATSVLLTVSLDATGRVTDVHGPSDGANPELVRAAEAAARKFVFEPARQDGTPIPVVIQFEYWFAAESAESAVPAPVPEASEAPAAAPPATPSGAPGAPSAPAAEEPLTYEGVAEVAAPPREPTRRTLPKERLAKVPGARGDAIRAIEVLPGVSRAPAGNNPILRGSGGHESLFVLDGVAIPELYHFGGLTSVVHPALLEEVNLYPGNFSARYGDATGGVVEARLRDPRMDGLHGAVDVNLIDSSALVEAPLAEGLGFAAAVRRSNIDFVFENFVPEGTFNVVAAPVYWDYQVLARYRTAPDEKLSFTATGSRDTLSLVFDEPNQNDRVLRGEVSGDIEFHSVTLGYSEHRGTVAQSHQISVGGEWVEQKLGPMDAYFDRLNVAERSEWDVEMLPNAHWILGLDLRGFALRGAYKGAAAPAQEGALGQSGGSVAELFVDDVTIHQLSPGAYSEARWFVTPEWLVIPGLRLDFYEDLDALTVDPRLNQRYALSSSTTLKTGIGAYSERPVWHESVLPVGNPAIDPYHAIHASVGAEQRLGEALSVDADAFYKYLYERVVATEGGVPPHFINDGEGRVYGLELAARYTPTSELYAQLAYTLSRSERQDRDDPRRLFDYDQTHVLNAAMAYQLGAGFELGARFRYVSGNPVTPVVGAVYDARNDYYIPRYGAQNSDRDPAFHQLDLRLDKRFEIGAGALTAYLELMNAYNAKNAEGYTYSYDYTEREPISGLPFFPNLGLKGEL